MQTVSYYPQTWPAAAPAVRRSSPWFLTLTGAVVVMGTVVLIEPAPIDLAIMGLLAVGLFFGQLAFVRRHELPLLVLTGFVLANVLSILNADSTPRAIYYASVTAYMLAWWLVFAGLPTRFGWSAVVHVMNGYVLAGVFSALLGTLSYLRVIGFQSTLLRFGRPKGLFKDPNVYGPYLVPVLLWALVRLQQRGKTAWQTAYWGMVAVIAAAGIFWSFSRACWINAGISLLAFFGIRLISGTLTRQMVSSAFRGLVAILLVGTVLFFGTRRADRNLESMLDDRLGSHGLKQYDSLRFHTQRLAWEAVRENPLGIGPGQAEPIFQYSTHSLYLRVLSENGYLGFLAFMAFLVLSLGRAIHMAGAAADDRWRTYFTVLGACMVGLLVNSLVIDTLHWRHFFLLLGLVWASHPSMRRREEPA